MAYVITDACVKDFVYAAECATSAIAPAAGDPAAGTISQVYINPDECIDCGNCATSASMGQFFRRATCLPTRHRLPRVNRAHFQ